MTLLEEHAPNPFEEVVRPRHRAGFSIEPQSIAWDAVVFSVHGARDAIVCVPRDALDGFFADLDDGRLDVTIAAFLASPPSGRVLRAAGQASRPGLFDALESHAAAVPHERVPGRGVLGGVGGGTPLDARRNKNRRGRPRRLPKPVHVVVGAAAIATIGIGVAVTRSGDDKTPVAVVAQPTTTTTRAGECHVGLCGTWDAIAHANIGEFPQTVHITSFDPATGKFAGDVNGSFIVDGVLTGSKMVWSYTDGGYRADFKTTVSGSGVGATFDGTFSDSNGSSGSFSATRTAS